MKNERGLIGVYLPDAPARFGRMMNLFMG